MKSNNSNLKKFEFTKKNLEEVDRIFAKYPDDQKPSAVMPLLDLAMRQIGGWITESAMRYISTLINVPYIRVYEVASFYSMFNLKPIGKNFIPFLVFLFNFSHSSLSTSKAYISELGKWFNNK